MPAEAGDLTELKEATERLHLQAGLLEAVGQAVIATALDGTIIYWNRAAEELYRWSSDEAAGKVLSKLIPSKLECARAEEVFTLQRRGQAWSGEFEMRRKNGEIFPALVTNTPIYDEEGEIVGVVGVSSDLSERKKLEVELRQAQKMEAVGRLAGGVAHDFNNLLTVIQLHTQLLLAGPGRDTLIAPDLLEIQAASRRAAELTRQLLAFGRKQVFEEHVVDLRKEVDGMSAMLRRMAPTNVTLDIEMSSQPAMVRADPVQIQQVLINLVVNAIDALSDREDEPGRIEIRVDHTCLSERDVAKIPWAVKPTDYVRLTVRDNGAGMSHEVLEHVFEPFYTTRDTQFGLGLASVYGIVKQSGGHLFVESEEESGAAFRILLPTVAAREEAPAAAVDRPPAEADGEAKTVLVVEDDRSVRNVAVRVLSSAGYDVLTAQHGKDALIVAADEAVRIDLVVTDIVMPELGGIELARELKRLRPALPIVLMSGYPREESGVDLAELGVAFLSKPFMVSELLESVAEALRR